MRRRTKLLSRIGSACTLFYLVVRLVLRRGATATRVFAWLAATAVQVFCYSQVAAHAAPQYGPNGELVDGGGDLDLPGSAVGYFQVLLPGCTRPVGKPMMPCALLRLCSMPVTAFGCHVLRTLHVRCATSC
jgi:hypothetical protein